MPTLTRWHIKTAFIYFAVALVLAALLAARQLIALPPVIAALTPVYVHFLIVGWVTQLIIGVAYWMFPKYSKDEPRRSERLAWAVFIMLNVGLVLRALAEPFATPNSWAGGVLAVSAVLQLLAGWGFVLNTWQRVKER